MVFIRFFDFFDFSFYMLKNGLLISLYFLLVLSYASWKGNAKAIETKVFHNSKGELVYPVPVTNLDQAKELGSGMYYSGTDGIKYIDINEQVVSFFNWETFFQVATFGCGLAVLLLLIVRLSTKFAKENE